MRKFFTLGHGRESAKKFLVEHPEIAAELDKKIRDAVLKSTQPVAPTEPEESSDDENFDGDE